MRWEIEGTNEFEAWYRGPDDESQDDVAVAVDQLAERGPGLGRPLVDTIKGSRHANMKELRVPSGNIRVLFAFDPRRVGILLIGGDKTGEWATWYKRMVPIADQVYDDYLEELRKEGLG